MPEKIRSNKNEKNLLYLKHLNPSIAIFRMRIVNESLKILFHDIVIIIILIFLIKEKLWIFTLQQKYSLQ